MRTALASISATVEECELLRSSTTRHQIKQQPRYMRHSDPGARVAAVAGARCSAYTKRPILCSPRARAALKSAPVVV